MLYIASIGDSKIRHRIIGNRVPHNPHPPINLAPNLPLLSHAPPLTRPPTNLLPHFLIMFLVTLILLGDHIPTDFQVMDQSGVRVGNVHCNFYVVALVGELQLER